MHFMADFKSKKCDFQPELSLLKQTLEQLFGANHDIWTLIFHLHWMNDRMMYSMYRTSTQNSWKNGKVQFVKNEKIGKKPLGKRVSTWIILHSVCFVFGYLSLKMQEGRGERKKKTNERTRVVEWAMCYNR